MSGQIVFSGGLCTEDGEIWTTVTERENDVYAIYGNTFNATTYFILISRTNVNFPHIIQGQNPGRIDITSFYYSIDVGANSDGVFSIGVITRIDNTDADLKFIMGVPFLAGASKTVLVDSLRGVPSQVKLDLDAGVLQHGVTNLGETNIVAINTGLTLDSPIGVITPGLGDVVVKYAHANGSVLATMFTFYHAHE